MMRFSSLGSGSDGNGLLVEVGKTLLLIDCGFGLNDTVARLAHHGVEPDALTAILITHEHDDHAGGAARVARKFNLPVWMTHGTWQATAELWNGEEDVRIFDCHDSFAVGDIEVTPYTVPHDAREPSQFVFGDGAQRLGLLTDAGSLTPHMCEVLSGLHALVLECNHDAEMLQNSDYPFTLKQRIAGKFGHLNNDIAAQLLKEIDSRHLQHLIAAHLSKQNNTPALAVTALSAAMNCEPEWIGVADQKTGFDWRSI